MPLNLGSLFFKLGADTSGLNKAERRAKQFANNTEKSFNKVSRSAKRVGLTIASMVTIEAARRTLMIADNYNVLQQRIRTATISTGDYVKVSSKLFAIANRNGTALQTNVELFQSLARAAPELGATNDQMLTLTELVGQLGVIGGSTNEQMKNGLLQFSQGMSAGILRAEEMNSLLENIPEVANRIAAGMGMTSGELRKAVVAGEVLSKDVFDSLLKQVPEIAKQFADMPSTIGRSTTMLKTSFGQFLHQINMATGSTSFIADTIQKAATYLGGDFTNRIATIQEKFSRIVDYMMLWKDLFSDISRGWQTSSDEASTMAANIKKFLGFLGTVIVEFPVNIRAVFHLVSESILRMKENAAASVDTMQLKFKILWDKVGHLGEVAAQFVQLKWAQATDAIVLYFANKVRSMGESLKNVPFMEGYSDQILAISDSMVAAANSTATMNNRIAESSEQYQNTIASLQAQIVAIENNRKAAIAASRARSDAALQEKEDALQGLKDVSIARVANRAIERAARIKDDAERSAALAKMLEEAKAARALELGSGTTGSSAKLDKAREAMQSKIDALTQSLSTERELEMQHYNTAIANLANAEQMKLDTLLPYQELRERLEEQHQSKLNAITEKYSKDRGRIGNIAAAFGVDIAKKEGAATLIAQGKAFDSMIDQAAQHSKEFFAIKKAMALATAMIEAPKAILSAFTFGSEMGGPILGGIFAGMAAAATAVQIGAIASQNYGGGRAKGGGVNAGMMYQVNEKGPEMLSVGNKDFLMMGNKGGHVTPNHKLGGGGNKVVVNVYPREGETAQVKQKETGDGMQIDVIIEAIEGKIAEGIQRGGSPVGDSMESQYGLNRSAGGVV